MTQFPDRDPQSGDGPSLQKGPGGAGGGPAPHAGYGPLPPAPGYSTPGFSDPGQPPVGYPPAGAPAGKPRNGLGTASLVLGILAIPAGLFAAFVGIIFGVLAIIFGVVTLSRVRKRTATNRGMAIAGIITGLIGAIIGTVFTVIAVRVAAECLDELGAGATQSQLEACATDKIGG
ncbi:MAG: DUF4190 domain-containing protein [Geodermatophilaceae bacterium]|nr:DUF4190 domain-containing protein [Geodermatophilaceae bacterium]